MADDEFPTTKSGGDSLAPENAQEITRLLSLSLIAENIQARNFRTDAVREGQRVGRYEIVRTLGLGGMSAVFEARHIYINHRVALKTMIGSGESPQVAERFLREARVLATLTGRGVVAVYDADMWDGIPFIVLELLKGGTVSDELRKCKRFSINRTLDLMEQIGEVLVRQERLNIVHRDIKPSNIAVRDNDSLCLLDYGLVGLSASKAADPAIRAHVDFRQLTQAGHVMGTPAYMSPEQANGTAVDHRSDLFNLGATAWHCLCGTPLRSGNGAHQITQLMSERVPSARATRPDVPHGLQILLDGLLAVDPNERYASADQFLEDLCLFRYQTRRPRGVFDGSLFVAIPFSKRFARVFDAIEKACDATRLRANRMDRLVFVDDIWNQTVNEIDRARVIVADFTWEPWKRVPNANVVTEAAHARAMKKPLVIITQNSPEQLPFDWRQMPVIRYRADKLGLESLSYQLSEKLRHLRNPN